MNKIKNILKSMLSIILNVFIYVISLIVPKSNKIWIFGSWFGNRFSDNSRYLYLYCNKYKEDLGLDHIIWITNNDEIYKEIRDKGLEVYKKWSLKSIWYHLRARVVLVDQGPMDVNKFFCIRCIKINLWHGFPLKRIGALSKSIDFKVDNNYSKYFKVGGWSNYYVQATSKLSKDILSKAFSVTQEKIITSAYPRNDVFTQDYWKDYLSKDENHIINEINKYKEEGYKVIFYLPTFRDNKSITLLNIKNKKEEILINNFLSENNLLLVTKSHFAQDNCNLDIKLDNFINLDAGIDVYPILEHSDILITDYSSVYFDFLITNKPIIFYSFDLKYYSDDSIGRGLLFDYYEFTPGDKAFSIDELLLSIQGVIDNSERYRNKYLEQYELIRKKVFDCNLEYGSRNMTKEIKKIFN